LKWDETSFLHPLILGDGFILLNYEMSEGDFEFKSFCSYRDKIEGSMIYSIKDANEKVIIENMKPNQHQIRYANINTGYFFHEIASNKSALIVKNSISSSKVEQMNQKMSFNEIMILFHYRNEMTLNMIP